MSVCVPIRFVTEADYIFDTPQYDRYAYLEATCEAIGFYIQLRDSY